MSNTDNRKTKDKLYYYFAEKNWGVNREYGPYVRLHPEEHRTNRLKHWWMLFRLNFHYRVLRSDSYIYGPFVEPLPPQPIRYYMPQMSRKSVDELFQELNTYDVVSFDIFDTALYRKVEFPLDVFDIMAIEMGRSDFRDIRKRAERAAREKKEAVSGTREILLDDIYRELSNCYGVDLVWADREIELELELSVANHYILAVYQKLISTGKKVIFTSDMYLPFPVVKTLLEKGGYVGYSRIVLSNEYGLRKGDGSLQQMLLSDYPGQRIVHVGDVVSSDVEKSIEAGIDAIHNPEPALPFREGGMENLGGSFYRSLVNRYLNNGLWNESLHYEHGFRVGGILAVGFCEYINRLVKEKNIDKILFCARDCDIIYRMYNQYFKTCENEYIQISRYAIMNVTAERNLYDLSNRYIMRYFDRNKNSKTVEEVLVESGFSYLVKRLEDADIDRFQYCSAIRRNLFERFILNQRDIIVAHNAKSTEAAVEYFDRIVGDSKRVLVVDVGWSGTCIDALKYFIETHLHSEDRSIYGALMCTSRNRTLTSSIADGHMSAYVYSPFHNMDLTRFMMPSRTSVKAHDLLHMPLEFLFTSEEQSVASYTKEENGYISFTRINSQPANPEEIRQMQAGMMHFAEVFIEETASFSDMREISPYVAFMPLLDSIRNSTYTYEVYKNFTYDAFTAPFASKAGVGRFAELFDIPPVSKEEEREDIKTKKTILFVTPHLTYCGAPRSLLRMCKVARDLGYHPVVWSARPGPFIAEYDQNGIGVTIVPEGMLGDPSVLVQLKAFDMAVCNTIETEKYAAACSEYIPTVWYIREATNVPDFVRNNPERLYTLQHSRDLYCVSEYAAEALQSYTKHTISVVRNSVEDETSLAVSYTPGTSEKIKFVQFGTIEYRKGYDVLLSAYLAMPEEYRAQSELYFAGGFIYSGAPFASYLFSRMKEVDNVHYLGVVQGEENKIRALSSMDVIVVASRDESCSLVALEGAMLSRPLIVTENVGAKYMVGMDNGFIVRTGDVEDLKYALMKMIDNRSRLQKMGNVSRDYYEKYASMDSYTQELAKMFRRCEEKNTLNFEKRANQARKENSTSARKRAFQWAEKELLSQSKQKEDVIVSLTSYPARIPMILPCIQSLLQQNSAPHKVLLWLSKEQFPSMNDELPEELLACQSNPIFEIHWVQEDLGPHKKYYYAMQEYPDLPIIIVDDDAIYDENLVGKLMASYRKHPDCISCMRGNLILFRENGLPRSYLMWNMGYTALLDQPSTQLMPTGIGGVLYPPHSLPEDAFDMQAIRKTCLFCDDLWLKIMSSRNGYRTIIPRDYCLYKDIEAAQKTALWKQNVNMNRNDEALDRILDYYENRYGNVGDFLERLRRDRFC